MSNSPSPPALPDFAWVAPQFTAQTVQALLNAARVQPPFHDLAGAARRLNRAAADLAAPSPPRAEAVAKWAGGVANSARDLLNSLGCDETDLASRTGLDMLEPFLLEADARTDLAHIAQAAGAHTWEARARLLRAAPLHIAVILLAARATAAECRDQANGGRTRSDRERGAVRAMAAAYRAATGKTAGVSPDGPAVRFVLEALAVMRRRPEISWKPTAQAVADMLRPPKKRTPV